MDGSRRVTMTLEDARHLWGLACAQVATNRATCEDDEIDAFLNLSRKIDYQQNMADLGPPDGQVRPRPWYRDALEVVGR